jgi:hypothetical protein
MKWKFLPGKEIPEDTPLWRYMSLGAFFLLLKRNTVFVPSLRKLQEADPKEMCVASYPGTEIDQFRSLPAFADARGWLTKLLSRTDSERHPDTDGKDQHPDTYWKDQYDEDLWLIKEWILQLGVRRWAWCWFSPGKPPVDWFESMAMWNLYARCGVMIKTTLENISMAFRQQDLTEALVAEVEYREPRVPITLPPHQAQEYIRRPFLFKSRSYRHEHEVRIVFQINAGAPTSGFPVKVDAETLLKGGEVIISPFLVLDEQKAIIGVAEGLLPEGTATFRPSLERAADPDSHHLADVSNELAQLSQSFHREADLPALLDEL